MDSPISSVNKISNISVPVTATSLTPDKTTEIGREALAAKEISSTSEIKPAKITLVKGQIKILIPEMFGFRPIEHIMCDVTVDKAYYSKAIKSLKEKTPCPCPSSPEEMTAIEYLFFTAMRDKKTEDAIWFSGIMRVPEFVNETTILASLYMISYIYQRQGNQNYEISRQLFLNALDSYPNSREIIQLHYHFERYAHHANGEVCATSNWARINPTNAADIMRDLFYRTLHRVDYLEELIEFTKRQPITNNLIKNSIASKQAIVQFIKGNYRESLRISNENLNYYPGHLDLAFTKCRSLLKLGLIKETVLFADQQGMSKHPVIVGLIHLATKDYNAANIAFTKYFLSRKDAVVPFWVILEYCQILNEVPPINADITEANLNWAIESDKDCVAAFRALIIIKIFQASPDNPKAIEEAKKVIFKGIEREPDKRGTYLQSLVLLYTKLGRVEESYLVTNEICTCLLAAKKIDEQLILSTGSIIYKQKRHDYLATFYRQCYEKTLSTTILTHYVIVMTEMDREREAIPLLETCFSKDPSCTSIAISLTSCYIALDHLDKALNTINKNLAEDPDNFAALTFRAKVYYRRKEYALAATEFSKITPPKEHIPMKYSYVSIWFECYLELGKFKQARKLITQYPAEISEAKKEELRCREQVYKERIPGKKAKGLKQEVM